jgi:excisionase family DNA binding protein
MQSICSTGASPNEPQGKGLQKGRAPPDDTDKLGFSIKEAAQASGLSRSLLYLVIGEGQLRARKCRGRTIILREDLQRFLASLPGMKTLAA